MDKVLGIICPDPDSQYLLRPCCECKSDNVAYVKYQHPEGERWAVRCFDCGATLTLDHAAPRHEVQVAWNRRYYAERY